MKAMLLIVVLTLLVGCIDEPAVSVEYGIPESIIVQRIEMRCPLKMRCVFDTTYDTIKCPSIQK